MKKAAILTTASLIIISVACSKHEEAAAPVRTFSVKGTVRQMVIDPGPIPDFPDHAGKAEFVSYCNICHSLRYITTQPDFPAKTWNAEVDKMIHKYGAPIDSATAKTIVNYLVQVKGRK